MSIEQEIQAAGANVAPRITPADIEAAIASEHYADPQQIADIDRSAVGKVARKIGGSYQADGRIVAEFKADDGSTRYVFRFDAPAGMLHIFNATQVEIRADNEVTK